MASKIKFDIEFQANASQLKKTLKDTLRTVNDEISTFQRSSYTMNENVQQGAVQAERFATALKRATTESGRISFKTLNAELAKAGTSMNGVIRDLTAAQDRFNGTITTALSTFVASDKALVTLTSRLADFKKTLSQSIKFTLSQTLQQEVVGAVQSASTWVKQLNTDLTQIAVVSNKSAAEMERVYDRVLEKAKELKVAASQYSEAALIFYQQGLPDVEVERRTEIAVKAAKAAGQDMETMSQQLTSVWNTYAMQGAEQERAASVGARLAAETAVGFRDIAEAMQIAASSAAQMGISYNSLSAQIATIGDTTQQSASLIGNALKTIYSRFEQLTTSGTDGEITLNEVSSKLRSLGIDVFDSAEQLRDLDDVINEVGIHWDQYTEKQQLAIAEIVGGTRQYGIFLALMNNFDKYLALNKSATSELGDTLTQQYETAISSIDEKQAQAVESWRRAFKSVFDTEVLKGFYDLLSGIGKIAEHIIEGSGGLIGVASVLTGILGSNMASGLTDFGSKIITTLKVAAAGGETQYTKNELSRIAAENSVEGATAAQRDTAFQAQVMSLMIERQAELNYQISKGTEAEKRLAQEQQKSLMTLTEQVASSKEYFDAIEKLGGVNNKKGELENAQQRLDFARKNFETRDSRILKKDEGERYNSLVEYAKRVGITDRQLEREQKNANGSTSYVKRTYQQIWEILQRKLTEDIKTIEADVETSNFYSLFNSDLRSILRGETPSNFRSTADTEQKRQDEDTQKIGSMINDIGEDLFQRGMSAEQLSQLFSEDFFNGLVNTPELQTTLDLMIQIGDQADRINVTLPESFQAFTTLAERTQDFNHQVQENDKRTKNLIASQQKLQVAIQGISAATMIVTSTFGLATQILKDGRITSESVADGFGLITGAILSLIPVIISLKTVTTLSFPLIGAIVAAIGAILAGISALAAAITKQIHDNSLEGKLEKIDERLTALNTHGQELKDTLSSVTEAFDSYQSFKDILDGCIEGTSEWTKALNETNDAALKLYKSFNGQMSWSDLFDDQGNLKQDNYDKFIKDQQEQIRLNEVSIALNELEKRQTTVENSLTSSSLADYYLGLNYTKLPTETITIGDSNEIFSPERILPSLADKLKQTTMDLKDENVIERIVKEYLESESLYLGEFSDSFIESYIKVAKQMANRIMEQHEDLEEISTTKKNIIKNALSPYLSELDQNITSLILDTVIAHYENFENPFTKNTDENKEKILQLYAQQLGVDPDKLLWKKNTLVYADDRTKNKNWKDLSIDPDIIFRYWMEGAEKEISEATNIWSEYNPSTAAILTGNFADLPIGTLLGQSIGFLNKAISNNKEDLTEEGVNKAKAAVGKVENIKRNSSNYEKYGSSSLTYRTITKLDAINDAVFKGESESPFVKAIAGLFENNKGKDNIIAQIFGEQDWKEWNAIDQIIAKLKDANIEVKSLEDKYKDLNGTLQNSNYGADKILPLIEKLSELRDIIKDIKFGDIITDEQYDELVKLLEAAGLSKEGFVKKGVNGNYITGDPYTIDALTQDNLLKNIESYNQIYSKEQLETMKEQWGLYKPLASWGPTEITTRNNALRALGFDESQFNTITEEQFLKAINDALAKEEEYQKNKTTYLYSLSLDELLALDKKIDTEDNPSFSHKEIGGAINYVAGRQYSNQSLNFADLDAFSKKYGSGAVTTILQQMIESDNSGKVFSQMIGSETQFNIEDGLWNSLLTQAAQKALNSAENYATFTGILKDVKDLGINLNISSARQSFLDRITTAAQLEELLKNPNDQIITSETKKEKLRDFVNATKDNRLINLLNNGVDNSVMIELLKGKEQFGNNWEAISTNFFEKIESSDYTNTEKMIDAFRSSVQEQLWYNVAGDLSKDKDKILEMLRNGTGVDEYANQDELKKIVTNILGLPDISQEVFDKMIADEDSRNKLADAIEQFTMTGAIAAMQNLTKTSFLNSLTLNENTNATKTDLNDNIEKLKNSEAGSEEFLTALNWISANTNVDLNGLMNFLNVLNLIGQYQITNQEITKKITPEEYILATTKGDEDVYQDSEGNYRKKEYVPVVEFIGVENANTPKDSDAKNIISTVGGAADNMVEANPVEYHERYKEISQIMDRIAKAMERYNKAADDAGGERKLINIKNATKLLEIQGQNYQKLYKEAQTYYETDKLAFESGLATIGKTAQYNIDGTIANIEEIEKAWEDYVGPGGTMTKSQKEAYDARKKTADEEIKNAKKLLETAEKLQTTYDEATANIREWLTKRLSLIQSQIKLKIDIDDSRLAEIKDFASIFGDIGILNGDTWNTIIDRMGLVAKEFGVVLDGAQQGLELIKELQTSYTEVDADRFKEAFGEEVWNKYLLGNGTLPQEALDQVREWRDQLRQMIMDQEAALQELFDDYTQKFQLLTNEFGDITRQLDSNANRLQLYQKLYEASGKGWSTFGKQQQAKLATTERLNADAILKESEAERKVYEKKLREDSERLARFEQENQLDSLTETQMVIYNNLHSIVEEDKQQLADATKQVTDALTDSIDKIKAELQAKLEAAKAEFVESMTGGLYNDWKQVMTVFENNRELLDFYLDDYDKKYNLDKLDYEISQQLLEVSDPARLEAWEEFQEKINKLRAEGIRLTQEQINKLQAEFELEQLRDQYEEAKNSKNTMRLARDASGNWSYVYSQDASASELAALEQKIRDKEKEIRDLGKEMIQTSEEAYMKMVDAEQAYRETVDWNLYEEDAKYKTQVDDQLNYYAEMRQRYVEIIQQQTEETGIAFQDTAIGITFNLQDITRFADETTLRISNDVLSIEELDKAFTENFKALTQERIDLSKAAQEAIGIDCAEIGVSYQDLDIQIDTDTENILDNIDSLEGEIENLRIKTIQALTDMNSELDDKIPTMASRIEEMVTAYKNLTAAIQETIDKSNELTGLGSPTDNSDSDNEPTDLNAPTDLNFGDEDAIGEWSIDNPMAPMSDEQALIMAKVINNSDDYAGYVDDRDPSYGWRNKVIERFGIDNFNKIYQMIQTHGYSGLFDDQTIYDTYHHSSTSPYTNLRYGAFATGGLVTKPTFATLAENDPELVLNPTDTLNILSAVHAVRRLNDTILLQNCYGRSGIGFLPNLEKTDSIPVQQDVKIEATFPNVSVAEEIEEAFNNLVNEAVQYVNRK